MVANHRALAIFNLYSRVRGQAPRLMKPDRSQRRKLPLAGLRIHLSQARCADQVLFSCGPLCLSRSVGTRSPYWCGHLF